MKFGIKNPVKCDADFAVSWCNGRSSCVKEAGTKTVLRCESHLIKIDL